MSAETIYALSTPPGRAGVAVIRISGPQAGAALKALSGKALPEARKAILRRLQDPASGELLDVGLILWFPAPNSFSGEDMAELHVHGGRAVVDGVITRLSAMSGLRAAEAGEFTKRAFENGKLDLTEVEGLADLVDAETEAQRRQSLRQMAGALGEIYDSWRQRLIKSLAYLEAELDFSDEDLPPDIESWVLREVSAVKEEITAHLDDRHRGQHIREGVKIAIVGAPNVGKSSLLNMLARRDAAIVSSTAGTTRDVIEVHLNLAGFAAVLADTAGLREAADDIEAEGVRRAKKIASEADLILGVFDATTYPDVDPETSGLMTGSAMAVLNKADLADVPATAEIEQAPTFVVSAKTQAGVEVFLSALTEKVADLCAESEAPPLTRARHREALEACREAITRLETAGESDLAAEDLRLAVRALGRITGRVDVEDLLDVIFRDFCIGK